MRADTISVHLASKHFTISDLEYGFNETNLGLGYGKTIHEHARLVTGFYKNSVRKDTIYGGLEVLQRFNNPYLTEVGITCVFVTGYNFPFGLGAYVRVADIFKVTAIPVVIRHPIDGVKADGIALGFSLTFGE